MNTILRRVALAFRNDGFIVSNRGSISTDGALDGWLFGSLFSQLCTDGHCHFLLQVGANRGNGSHDLRQEIGRFGLRAILVEPQPEVYSELQANYAGLDNVTTVRCALSNHPGPKKLYRIKSSASKHHARGGRFGDGIASFDKDHPWRYFIQNATKEGRRLSRVDVIESMEVPCMSLGKLLGEHAICGVDVLLIDTEGFDMEILRMVFDSSLEPRLIKYEHKHLCLRDRRESWRMLIAKGYRLVVVKVTGDTVAFRPS